MPEKAPNLALAFNLPPEQAVKYFESKGYAITWGWRDMEAAAHARAFTVAGVTRLDVLQDIRDALQRALNEGRTYAQFKADLIPLLQRKGWWGKLAQTDMDTGEMAGKGLTPRRLETIFRTNVQSAYMAGRYKTHLENVGDRPWWQYVAIMDSRTRPQHSALNGRVFRYDDPFWNVFYPPLSWNCRCRVRAFTDAEIKKRGIATSISGRNLEQVELPDPYRPGQTLPRTRFEYAPGKYITPDIGWEGNPGRDADLAEWAERKLATADAAIAAQARRHLGLGAAGDNVGMKAAEDFVEQAILDPRNKQGALELVAISSGTVGKAAAVGIDLRGKSVALDHDGVIHAIKKHGGESERLRGQEPIGASDLALFGEIVNIAETVAVGNPPVASDGTKFMEGGASLSGYDYGFVARVRRKYIVPQTLWKRLRK